MKDVWDFFYVVCVVYVKFLIRLKVSWLGVWFLGLGFSVYLSVFGLVMMMMCKFFGVFGCFYEILFWSLGCYMYLVDLGFLFVGLVCVGLFVLKVKEWCVVGEFYVFFGFWGFVVELCVVSSVGFFFFVFDFNLIILMIEIWCGELMMEF